MRRTVLTGVYLVALLGLVLRPDAGAEEWDWMDEQAWPMFDSAPVPMYDLNPPQSESYHSRWYEEQTQSMFDSTPVPMYDLNPPQSESYRSRWYEDYEQRRAQEQLLDLQRKQLDVQRQRLEEQRQLRSWHQRRYEDRIRARQACNFIDRNPAAQQRCYDSLR